MQIKQLFVDAVEYQKWFQSLLDAATNPNASLWREEDREKLEPFFRWNHIINSGSEFTPTKMSDEVRASFEHYKQCEHNYGREASAKRNALRQFGFEDLCDIFGFELIEPDNDESDAIQLSHEFGHQFPLLLVGHIDSSYCQGAEDKMAAISIISLSEFNLVVAPKSNENSQI